MVRCVILVDDAEVGEGTAETQFDAYQEAFDSMSMMDLAMAEELGCTAEYYND